MKKFLLVLITLFISLSLLIYYRSWRVQNSSFQKVFLTGTLPSPPPDGFYKGSIQALETSWKGKIFDASKSAGINLISDKQVYPFKTYPAKSLTDKNLEVLRLDYNTNQNPFWARAVVDEVVQHTLSNFTGKVFIKLIPGFPISLGFFKLER